MLNEIIAKEKKEYLEELIKLKRQVENIVIYGAGKVGKTLHQVLKEADIHVASFCVTDKMTNRTQACGVPVVQIDELEFHKDNTLILIGIRQPWNQSAINTLIEKGWKNYIDVPYHVLYFIQQIQGGGTRPIMDITTKIGCSVQCKFCPQELLYSRYFSDQIARESMMTFNTFRKCIDKTPMNTIVSFGGFVEPFLNPACIEMLLYVNQTGRDIALYTTLVGLDVEQFNKIKEIPFLKVVLHVPDEEKYAYIPMTNEYFEVLGLVLNTKNKNGDWFVGSANCQGTPHSDVLRYTAGKVLVSSELHDRAGNLEGDNLGKKVNLQGEIYCAHAVDLYHNRYLNHNELLPDGTVVLCCMDFGLKHVLGNLLYMTYEEMMQSDQTNRVLRAMEEQDGSDIICRNCVMAKCREFKLDK